jgi:hypothetical protein
MPIPGTSAVTRRELEQAAEAGLLAGQRVTRRIIQWKDDAGELTPREAGDIMAEAIERWLTAAR